MIKNSYIFSYWIFIWFLTYILIGRNKIPNPKFILIIATLHNIISLLLMIIYGTKSRIIYLFIIGMLLIKIIPTYTLYNTKIHTTDIYATIYLFICYLCWLKFNNQKITRFFTDIKDLIFNNKNITPAMKTLDKFLSQFNI